MDGNHLKISDGRWEKAQQTEREFWISQQHRLTRNAMRRPLWKWPFRLLALWVNLKNYNLLPTGDDDNVWWSNQFENYTMIPARLANVLEIGCGPHTNLRCIIQGRSVEHAFASDPLAKDYLKLPRTWLRYAYGQRMIMLDDHPAEECPFASDYFDLVVMINVLDHVKDAMACLQQAVRVVKADGLLLIGQDLGTEETVRNRPNGFDIAHPIWLKAEHLNNALTPFFNTEFYKILPRKECREPKIHAGTYLFCGKKKVIA